MSLEETAIRRVKCTIPFDQDYNGRPKVKLVEETATLDPCKATSSNTVSTTTPRQTPLLALVTHPFYCMHKPRYGRCYEVRIGRPFESKDNGWSRLQLLTSCAGGLYHDFDMVDVWIKAWPQLSPILNIYLATLTLSSAASTEQRTTLPRFGNLATITLTKRRKPVTLYIYRYSDVQLRKEQGLAPSINQGFEDGTINLEVIAAISAAPDCVLLVASRDMQALPAGQYHLFQPEVNTHDARRIEVPPMPITSPLNATHNLTLEMPCWMDELDGDEVVGQQGTSSSEEDDDMSSSSEAPQQRLVTELHQLVFGDPDEDDPSPQYANHVIEAELQVLMENDGSSSLYYEEIWSLEAQNTIVGHVTGDAETGEITIALALHV